VSEPGELHAAYQQHLRHSAANAGESTSARLRRAEQERDEMAAELERLRAWQKQALDRVKRDLDDLEKGRRYNGWNVARDAGRTCATCKREITVGQAYSVDGVSANVEHVFCPEVTDA
jgi:hypothetical protein